MILASFSPEYSLPFYYYVGKKDREGPHPPDPTEYTLHDYTYAFLKWTEIIKKERESVKKCFHMRTL